MHGEGAGRRTGSQQVLFNHGALLQHGWVRAWAIASVGLTATPTVSLSAGGEGTPEAPAQGRWQPFGCWEVWRTWGGVCLVQGGAGRAGRASHRSSPTVEVGRACGTWQGYHSSHIARALLPPHNQAGELASSVIRCPAAPPLGSAHPTLWQSIPPRVAPWGSLGSHTGPSRSQLWRTRRLYSLAPSRSHPSLSLRPEAGRSLMALAHDLEQPSAHLPDAACSLPVASHRLTISRAPSLHPYPMSLFRPLPCRILYCQFPRQ